ncbi:MAG: hypothetical protein JWP92_1758 [Caulobacter sp.]|nr:hypothetical protein [Caulobacter sp.]
MRVVTGTISGLCLAAAAHVALAQTPSPAPAAQTKATKAAKPTLPVLKLSPTAYGPAPVRDAPLAAGFAPRPVGSADAEIGGLFALSPAASQGDARLLESDRFYDGRGPVSWRSSGFAVTQASGVVDSVRISTAVVAPIAKTAPLSLVRPDSDAYETGAVDVSVVRGWPSAMKLGKGRYALDVSPHAGLGFGGAGGSAEAGATVRFGRNVGDRAARALGVRDGHDAFGDRGRWYLFAAASGQAVGLNLLRGQEGDWSRGGFTSDTSSKLIGDAQAGVGWRRGPMQASVGYIHRQIKAKDQIMGMATQEDSVVALSFSFKPHR